MELVEIVFVLGILLLVFGPEKLPVLARQIGEAIYEFRKASSGIPFSSAARTPSEIKEALETMARKMEIETEGKTIKQIARELRMKVENENPEK